MSRATAPRAPSARWVRLRRYAALAAATGGTAWTVKAVVTLGTGDEPPAAFAIGFVLFPFALLGLWSLVRKVDGRAPSIGGAIAATAAVSVVLAALIRAVGGSGAEPTDDEVTVLSPFIAIGGFGTFAALVVLGFVVRRAGALSAPYTSLPWTMGVAAIPLLIVGGALQAVSERLLEIPIALLGLGWIAVGVALWNAAPQQTSTRTATT